MVQANNAFKYIRPDEVAECWNGVIGVGGLYEALWDCVDSYKGPTPEESEEPVIGLNSVADYWDRFSESHKAELNRLAEEN